MELGLYLRKELCSLLSLNISQTFYVYRKPKPSQAKPKWICLNMRRFGTQQSGLVILELRFLQK